MSAVIVERRRSGSDIVVGALVIVAGLFVLADALFASTVAVNLIGAVTLGAGAVLLIGGIARAKQEWGWVPLAGGALLIVLGLFMLVRTEVALVTIALVAGALFLVGGLARLMAAIQPVKHRLILVISGLVSIGLGLYVLFGPTTIQMKVIGILLGIQVVIEGLTLITLGRVRVLTR